MKMVANRDPLEPFLKLLKRGKVFSMTPRRKPWPLRVDAMVALAREIGEQHATDGAVGREYLSPIDSHREATIVYRQAVGGN